MEKKDYEYQIIVKESGDLTEEDISNFLYIHEMEYGNKIPKFKIQKKYFQNIYGASILIFAYDNKNCIGTQVFLRNDLNEGKAYQSSDSIVLSKYRGKGLFSKMVMAGVSYIGETTLIYGFPNNDSLPAFRKMGWQIGERKKYSLWHKKDMEEICQIDNKYFQWMVRDNGELRCLKRGKRYYLAKPKKYKLYVILGEITKEQSQYLKRSKGSVAIYYSEKGRWGNGMVPIWIHKDNLILSEYKMDTLL